MCWVAASKKVVRGSEKVVAGSKVPFKKKKDAYIRSFAQGN